MSLLADRNEKGSEASVTSLELRGFRNAAGFTSGLVGQCANRACSSGWLHPFRRCTRPFFEGEWTCSQECTEALLHAAVRRELSGWTPDQKPHRHRIPLGLLMLGQGWVTPDQLRRALVAHKNEENLRIGECLMKQGAIDEATVSRALSMQWGCPVLSLDDSSGRAATGVVPRLFVETSRALPIRIDSDRILYLGFEETVDSALAFSVERMTGLRVECGIVDSSAFNGKLRRALRGDISTSTTDRSRVSIRGSKDSSEVNRTSSARIFATCARA